MLDSRTRNFSSAVVPGSGRFRTVSLGRFGVMVLCLGSVYHNRFPNANLTLTQS